MIFIDLSLFDLGKRILCPGDVLRQDSQHFSAYSRRGGCRTKTKTEEKTKKEIKQLK